MSWLRKVLVNTYGIGSFWWDQALKNPRPTKWLFVSYQTLPLDQKVTCLSLGSSKLTLNSLDPLKSFKLFDVKNLKAFLNPRPTPTPKI